MCVHLYLASEEDPSIKGALKMRALLQPTTATPLTSISLLCAISQAPFDLLLTYLRILFNAWKLHYRKRLDVFLHPEPLVVVKDSCPIPAPGGCVRWQDERVFERFCQDHISKFLKKRAKELGVEIISHCHRPFHSATIIFIFISSTCHPENLLQVS